MLSSRAARFRRTDVPNLDHSDDLNTRAAAPEQQRHSDVVIGRLIGIDDFGMALVDWPDNPAGAPQAALSTAAYGSGDAGRAIALLFAGGDPKRPLIVGLIREPLDHVLEATEHLGAPENGEMTPMTAEVNGEHVVIEGKKDVVLKCGESSITLTRAGKNNNSR